MSESMEAHGPVPGIGHNTAKKKREADLNRLAKFVERIERVEVEMEERREDRREIYAEAKAAGFNVKVMQKLIRLRARPPKEEEEELLDDYKHKLGM